MISLVCTKCSTVLNVDDGFAGGVCRCSACGTIQTVPRKGDAPTKAGAPGTVIYERASREAVSKELEALGEVVTSSGIVGSGILTQSRVNKPKQSSQAGKWLGVAAGSLLSLAAVWFLFLRPSNAPEQTVDPKSTTPAANNLPKANTAAGPRFGPIALDRTGPLVYLIDRGDATRPYTSTLHTLVNASLATLQPNRRFQIRYWTAAGESPAFPLTPGEPSEYNRSKAATWMSEVIGGQSTDAVASLDAALLAKPAEIVLITGKAWQMDETFTNQAVIKLVNNPVRIHVVSLGTVNGEDPLQRLASKTGGTYLALDANELQQLTE